MEQTCKDGIKPNEKFTFISLTELLGHVDMIVKVSTLASHMALPREGQFLADYHVFSYLKLHHNSFLVFVPSNPDIDKSIFVNHD